MHYYERLREIRNEKGYTQEEVAKALDTNQRQIVRWEKGLHDMQISNFIKICKYYKVKPSDIMKLED